MKLKFVCTLFATAAVCQSAFAQEATVVGKKEAQSAKAATAGLKLQVVKFSGAG